MASPQPTGKQFVNLAATDAGPRVSRIRRDPPPVIKAPVVIDVAEREQWAVVFGVLTFALAIFVIIVAFAIYAGWSPAQYTIEA
ncbi:MAG: hypothetical protein ABI626_02225 [Sphingomicrobium sp.]